jgi:endonuclease YncB( thermonuclease family)
MAEKWEYPNSTLERVIDGDSLVVKVSRVVESDFGFHIKERVEKYAVQRFRLDGYAAAPNTTASGMGAAMRLAELLVTNAPFHLTSVGPYKYGDEWMARILLSDGRDLAVVLIAEQWGVYWNGRGTQPRPPWPRTVG